MFCCSSASLRRSRSAMTPRRQARAQQPRRLCKPHSIPSLSCLEVQTRKEHSCASDPQIWTPGPGKRVKRAPYGRAYHTERDSNDEELFYHARLPSPFSIAIPAGRTFGRRLEFHAPIRYPRWRSWRATARRGWAERVFLPRRPSGHFLPIERMRLRMPAWGPAFRLLFARAQSIALAGVGPSRESDA